MPGWFCDRCKYFANTYNQLIEHGQQEHGDKQIDPGNEFSGPGKKRLADVIAWLRRQPDANLKTGEGKLLLDEIDRLAGELLLSQNTVKLMERNKDETIEACGRLRDYLSGKYPMMAGLSIEVAVPRLLDQCRCPHNEVKLEMTIRHEVRSIVCAICGHHLATVAIHML